MSSFESEPNAARRNRFSIRKSFGYATINGDVIQAYYAGHDPASNQVIVQLLGDDGRIYVFDAPPLPDWETGELLTDKLVGLWISIYGEITADVESTDAECPSAGTFFVRDLKDISFIRGWLANARGWRPFDVSPFDKSRGTATG
jgi:hypothetical protein